MRFMDISNPYINYPFLIEDTHNLKPYDGGRLRKSSPLTTEFYFPVWL